ncbi:phage integrase central domain-containing protein [Croceibacterium ferulae]|uniref:phage integrase central domain-containing protein n=1 Tax=Croceibacterium ferulae TaxID=1854641 RepID=UPI000F86ED92|nr:hypothetical protein [Croceibacterium ferulae]
MLTHPVRSSSWPAPGTHIIGRHGGRHATDVLCSLGCDVLPGRGELAPDAIETRALLNALRSVERRCRVANARRTRHRLSEISTSGIADGLCAGNLAGNRRAAMQELPPEDRTRSEPRSRITARCWLCASWR